MAVYTHIDEDELRTFLEGYDLGEPVAFKGIAEGVENSNYFLETTKDRFILTLFEKRAAPEDLPYFVRLMDHLATKGFPAPLPIKGEDGQALRKLKGKHALIVSFLSGISPRRPSPAQCRAIGETMARMHLALEDFPLTRTNDLGPGDWPGLMTGRDAVANTLQPGLADLVHRDLASVVEDWPTPDSLPRGTIHADLFPDNAFFLGETASGVIDFYFACTDALAYDIAVNLNAWCFESRGEFNHTKGHALLSGYQSVRPLSVDECDALPLLARGAALRFFLTRLVDWSDTPEDALVRPKNPMDYAERLTFHRSARDLGDYGG